MADDNTLERNETHDMISSAKVEGTAVFDRDGNKIGAVHHVMIGKRDGKVRHAVVSYGGFLGLGEDYFPLPWNELTYDEDRSGYVVRRDVEQLRGGPHYPRDREPAWDRAYDAQVTGYYA